MLVDKHMYTTLASPSQAGATLSLSRTVVCNSHSVLTILSQGYYTGIKGSKFCEVCLSSYP